MAGKTALEHWIDACQEFLMHGMTRRRWFFRSTTCGKTSHVVVAASPVVAKRRRNRNQISWQALLYLNIKDKTRLLISTDDPRSEIEKQKSSEYEEIAGKGEKKGYTL
ncbi:MAG: hypothetical protein HON43_00175 [Alphaproteobacteria bacterium]|nr:hypothetical protein [Alphaproteobacteria bacterium]MBT5389430.1 hypothetical protein [Alphaproteobacteria bacterium]